MDLLPLHKYFFLEAFSLLEVNQYIKRVLALNFDEPFWVECELNQVSHSRGNVYLQLIEKAEDSDEVLAKNSAQIWYRQYLFIKKKLGKLVDSILKEGILVKLKVVVNYSERYGLSLVIEDIDPSYTFGQFEMNRQKILEQLKQKDLLDKNAQVPLPSVIQNVAVISSETAAGYQDFVQQLTHNAYGYDFQIFLYQSAMQGQKTEADVVAALREARTQGHDVIAIIRGGGAKLDLAAFDNYNIAFEVAASSTPVITGIGHDIDQTVTDVVAHTVVKTPTAVADLIIEHNAEFEGNMLGLESMIAEEVRSMIAYMQEDLIISEERIRSIPQASLTLNNRMLSNMQESIVTHYQQKLKQEKRELESIGEQLALLDPANILSRGFAVVRQGKDYILSKSKIDKAKEDLEIEFKDGVLNVKQV